MANRNHVTAKRRFGIELRRVREAKRPKMTQLQLAELMHVSESLVAAWESGRQHPKPEYLPHLINTLGISVDDLLKILEDLMENQVSPEWTDKWLKVEQKAETLLSCEPVLVTGLLQTEDYARSVLQYRGHTAARLEERMQRRLDRQQLFTREDPEPPMMVFLMDEYVLHRPIGNAEICSRSYNI